MSDALTFYLDTSGLEANIRRYVSDCGVELPKVVKQTFKLVIRDTFDLTPPFRNGKGGKKAGSDYAQGRAAVENDLYKVFNPLDTNQWWGVFTENNGLRILHISTKGNRRGASVLDEEHFLKRSEMKAFHKSRRNARGRVKYTDQRNLIGRKKSDISQVGLVKKRDFNSYLKEVQSHVGVTRKGWAPALEAVGLNVPDWVSRHSSGPGRVDVSKMMHPDNPSITAVHDGKTTPSIDRRTIQNVVNKRADYMETDIERILMGGKSNLFKK